MFNYINIIYYLFLYCLLYILLTTLFRPVLDGVQTTKLIRSKYASSAWPYIASMTADAFPGII